MSRELDDKHANDPQRGDCWMDHGSACFLVIDVGALFVAYLSKTKAVDSHSWTWDTSHVEVSSRAEFKKRISYSNIPGTWAYVVPNSSDWKEFAEEALKQVSINKFATPKQSLIWALTL